jgi:hypothetical protein
VPPSRSASPAPGARLSAEANSLRLVRPTTFPGPSSFLISYFLLFAFFSPHEKATDHLTSCSPLHFCLLPLPFFRVPPGRGRGQAPPLRPASRLSSRKAASPPNLASRQSPQVEQLRDQVTRLVQPLTRGRLPRLHPLPGHFRHLKNCRFSIVDCRLKGGLSLCWSPTGSRPAIVNRQSKIGNSQGAALASTPFPAISLAPCPASPPAVPAAAPPHAAPLPVSHPSVPFTFSRSWFSVAATFASDDSRLPSPSADLSSYFFSSGRGFGL